MEIQGLAAARITDLATCAQAIEPVSPATTLPITSSSTTVFMGSLGAARITDVSTHPWGITAPGGPSVPIGN